MKNKKVIIITGASSGIGKSTAQQLLSEGHTVYGAARRIEKMDDLKADGIKAIKMDVTDEKSVKAGVDQLIKEQGRIDVLVNNAGYGSYGSVEDVPISEGKKQFDVNIFGLAQITQLVLPHMRKQKSGTVINISSMGGIIYSPLGAWYHATKHALEGFSDCLRFEVAPFGINVVIIEPGGIKTEWDTIALDNMKARSGKTAYASLTEKTVKLFETMYKSGSHPSVIAKTISKAIKAKRPKTRYASGYMAKPYIMGRRIFSDRIFDWMLKASLK